MKRKNKIPMKTARRKNKKRHSHMKHSKAGDREANALMRKLRAK